MSNSPGPDYRMLPGGSPNGGPSSTAVPLAPPMQTPAVFWLREYVGIINRHIWLVAAITVLTVAIALSMVLKEPPVYAASAAVRLVDTRPTLAGDLPPVDRPLGTWTDPVLTQIQVLRSRAVAALAVDSSGVRMRPMGRRISMQHIQNVYVNPSAGPDTVR